MRNYLAEEYGFYCCAERDLNRKIDNLITTGRYVLGEEGILLEKRLAAYVGVPHVVTCASGTDALRLALMACELNRNDEVIQSVYTFGAAAEMTIAVGARPVFVDVDADGGTDPDSVLRAISKKTKVVIATNLYGLPVGWSALQTICLDHGLILIEDAAQSFGASYGEKMSCALGDISITSFYPTKPLGCFGDGGAVFTRHPGYADTIRCLRNHGQAVKYDYIRPGCNSRLDEIQAVVLNCKLESFPYMVRFRRDVWQYYKDGLSEDVDVVGCIESGKRLSACSHFVVSVPEKKRLKLYNELKRVLPVTIHYPLPLHRQAAFMSRCKNSFSPGIRDYVNADFLSKTVLCLPVYPLMTRNDVKEACEILNDNLT